METEYANAMRRTSYKEETADTCQASHNCDECLPDEDIRRVLTEAALQLTEAQRQMGVVFIKENEWQKQICHKTQQLTVAQEDRDRAFAAHVDCASQMTSCTRC